MRRLTLVLLLGAAGAALAQEPSPPPGPPVENPCQQPGWERDPRCRPEEPPVHVGPGVEVGIPTPSYSGGPNGPPPTPKTASVPKAAIPPPKSGGGGGGGCGNLDGRALLVAAVIAAVALPAVIYAVDDDVEDDVTARYLAFHAGVDAWGGAMTTNANPFGLTGVRARVTQSYFGLEGSFEGTPLSADWRSANVSLLFRLAPKKHVEISIAVGGRWSLLNGEERLDAELAVPHRYVFFHSGDQTGGIEVRPAVLVGKNGADVRLDLGLVVPVGSVIGLSVGGRVFTYDFQQVNFAAVGGLSAHF